MQHHASRAREVGVDVQDIVMAIEIGKATRKGAAARMDQYVSAVFKES